MSNRKACDVLVCGAGGFIGGWLVAGLRSAGGLSIRAVDIKPLEQWYQRFEDVENLTLDLQDRAACERAVAGSVREVYNLAANMGGIGFIEHNKTLCMLSVLINTHLLMASRKAEVQKYLFGSSACVYAADKQTEPNVTALKEEDAYPASPEDGCASISRKTSDCTRASPATTMSMVHTAPLMVAGRRRPRPFVARSYRPSFPENTKLKSGATAIKRAALCTLTTALKAPA